MIFAIIIIGVLFIVISSAKFKLHPFLGLIIAALFVGIASGMPLADVVKNINEGFGDGNSSFRDYEYVIGPDGTVYDTKQIIGLVNVACDLLIDITQGTIAEFLVALPIIYTFQVDTMATDTEYIYINPGFVLKLLDDCGGSPAGIAFVMCLCIMQERQQILKDFLTVIKLMPHKIMKLIGLLNIHFQI